MRIRSRLNFYCEKMTPVSRCWNSHWSTSRLKCKTSVFFFIRPTTNNVNTLQTVLSENVWITNSSDLSPEIFFNIENRPGQRVTLRCPPLPGDCRKSSPFFWVDCQTGCRIDVLSFWWWQFYWNQKRRLGKKSNSSIDVSECHSCTFL